MERELFDYPPRLILEHSLTGYVFLDRGRIVDANARCIEMLGYPDATVIRGRSVSFLEHEGEAGSGTAAAPGALRMAVSRAAEEVAVRGSAILRHADGGQVHILFLCLTVDRNHDRAVLQLADNTDYQHLYNESEKVMLDLEEAKLAQEENAGRLNELLAELEAARAVELEREKLKGVLQMAVTAAHEMAQPLQAMAMEVSFLQTDVQEGSDEFEALESLDDAIRRMGAILDRIRGITRTQSTEYGGNTLMIDLEASGDGE